MDRRDAEAAFDHPSLEASTIPGLFAGTAARHSSATAQSYKGGIFDRSLVAAGAIPAAPDGEYADLSYSELETVVQRLAAGFRDLGLGADDRLAIVSHTRMEWTQVDLAALSAGGVVTAAYPSATDDRLESLLSDAGPTGIVVENAALLKRLLAVEPEVDPAFVVVMDSLPDGSGMAGAARDRDDIYPLGTVYQRGEAVFDSESWGEWLDARGPDDLASIIYTSGTTGEPKGVRLTHGNFCANADGMLRRLGPRSDHPDGVPQLDQSSRQLSVLPLAHVFERLVGCYLPIAAGATIAYAESPETLAEDFKLVSPTCSTAVPRLYERLFESFEREASSSAVSERLFKWAVDIAERFHRTDSPGRRLRLAHSLADRLVYSSIRAALGGEIELFISGGDSLSAELCAIFHGMGLPIFEGYGLTETAPVVSVNPPEVPRVGTVGPPVINVETRVDTTVDVEAGDFDAADGETEIGELLVRGPNVTDGYWQRPASTDAAFVSLDDDDDREWFRTGDLVEQGSDGYLTFRGRRKELVVLSTGQNVVPGPIEESICESSLIEQCLLVGDGWPAVGALVVPDFEAVQQWADSKGVDLPSSTARIADDERVRSQIETAVERATEGVEPHERIEWVALVDEPFTVANGLLTPTLKKKWRAITDRYADLIDRQYE